LPFSNFYSIVLFQFLVKHQSVRHVRVPFYETPCITRRRLWECISPPSEMI